jgi:hypothetical protein
MRTSPLITRLGFSSASELDSIKGVIGWVRFRFRGLIIDGCCVRRTRSGQVRFCWAERKASTGRLHPLVLPEDRTTRVAVEAQVLAELRARGKIA